MNGREKTCDEVLIQRLILAHLVDRVPLLRRHALLDGLRGVFHVGIIAVHLRVRRDRGASLKMEQGDFLTVRHNLIFSYSSPETRKFRITMPSPLSGIGKNDFQQRDTVQLFSAISFTKNFEYQVLGFKFHQSERQCHQAGSSKKMITVLSMDRTGLPLIALH